MTDSEYKPVRVLRGISVTGANEAELAQKFPHAVAEVVKGRQAVTYSRTYTPGQVVDAPTEEERVLFDSVSDLTACNIPRGAEVTVDDPRSNLARSRDAAYRGYSKFLSETAARAAVSKPPSKKSASKKKDTKSDKSTEKGGDDK